MIEVSNLTRYYGDFAALEDVSFTLKQGEIVGLLGLNGAGKSTTLKILAGLLAPSEGTVRIDGKAPSENPSVLGKIGYLPESPPLYTEMTVSGFITHIARIKGMSSAEAAKRLPEVLDLADLKDRANQVISTLSHGYRKRVGIAQAVIHNPQLVILDEPISGLDPAQIVEMRKVVRGLAKGRAVIVSSHILNEISQTCDRILVVDKGRLVAEGTEAELRARSQARAGIVMEVSSGPEPLAEWVRSQPNVTKVTPESENRVAVELSGSGHEPLVAALVKAGFSLRWVEQPDDELEGIFLSLTAREAA